jgi:hypothetical protein
MIIFLFRLPGKFNGEPPPTQLTYTADIYYAIMEEFRQLGHVSLEKGYIYVYGIACYDRFVALLDVPLDEIYDLVFCLLQGGGGGSDCIRQATSGMLVYAPVIHGF